MNDTPITRSEAQTRIIDDLKAHLQMHEKFAADPTLCAVAGEMLARVVANQPLAVPQDDAAPLQS